jgi:hypothetical protein
MDQGDQIRVTNDSKKGDATGGFRLETDRPAGRGVDRHGSPVQFRVAVP